MAEYEVTVTKGIINDYNVSVEEIGGGDNSGGWVVVAVFMALAIASMSLIVGMAWIFEMPWISFIVAAVVFAAALCIAIMRRLRDDFVQLGVVGLTLIWFVVISHVQSFIVESSFVVAFLLGACMFFFKDSPFKPTNNHYIMMLGLFVASYTLIGTGLETTIAFQSPLRMWGIFTYNFDFRILISVGIFYGVWFLSGAIAAMLRKVSRK